jgi:hypothetical protein
MTGGWKRLYNEELDNSQNIIRMTKSRRLRWAGNVAGIAEMRNAYTVFYLEEYIKERDRLLDTDVDGRMILKLILKESDVKVWSGFIWLRIGTDGGLDLTFCCYFYVSFHVIVINICSIMTILLV